MKQPILANLKREPQRSILFLALLILLRAIGQINLYQRGFISASADEFARGLRAASWAANPEFNLITDIQGTWLPLEKYINGLFLLIWPDVIVAPRITVFVASCLLLIVLYLLVYYLFGRWETAVLAAIFITVQPWYTWLSGTPMLEMYYFFCFFAGLLFLLVWLREKRPFFWLWGSLFLLLASALHVQSWTQINLLHLLTLPAFFQLLRQKAWRPLAQLVAFYLISNSFILAYSFGDYLITGELFAFLGEHTTYSRWFYGGYNVPVLEKFLYYPRIVVRTASTVLWIGVLLGVAFLRADSDRRWKFLPLQLTLLALLLNSLLNILSGPPSAAPARYGLFHIINLSLYAVYGFYRLAMWRPPWLPRLVRLIFPAFAAMLFLYGLQWGASRIPNFPRGMSPDPVNAGRALSDLLTDPTQTYLVELIYWEYLAIDLTTGQPDGIRYDRELNFTNRDLPSLFEQSPPNICRQLADSDVSYLLLKNEAFKQTVEQLNVTTLRQDVGEWTIFQMGDRDGCVAQVDADS